jgi:undecaprenyl diphosphate synthase
MHKENTTPNHLAIIMDGNGRWATNKGLERSRGHVKGYEQIKPIALHAKKLGIKYLTLFAFSTENWKRSKNEIEFILDLAINVIAKESENLNESNINISHLGNKDNLPFELINKIQKSENLTKNNDGLFLSVAFNYGSRSEIINAVNNLLKQKNKIIDENKFVSNLMTTSFPDPDIILRTGGQKRLSNFLLWQSAYSELFFLEKFWPDFTISDLEEIVSDYKNRKRNYGT